MTSNRPRGNWRTSCSDTAFSRTCASLRPSVWPVRQRQGVHGEVGRGVGDQVEVVHLGAGWAATQAAVTWAVSWRETDWAPVMAESM